MVTQSHEWKYAQTVNEQSNPNTGVDKTFNTSLTNSWKNMQNANGGNTGVRANGYYTKKYKTKYSYEYIIPRQLTAHDFRLEIPEEAYVKSVTIEVRLSVDKGIKVKAPTATFMIYGGNGNVKQLKRGTQKTGWNFEGNYAVYQDKYISTAERTFEYTIGEADWNGKKYPTDRLNKTIMGIDIDFREPEYMANDSATVYLDWARIRVDYVLPSLSLEWQSDIRDINNPRQFKVNEANKVNLQLINSTKANGGTQNVDIQLPFGTKLNRYSATKGTLQTIDAFHGQYRWVVEGEGLSKSNLELTIESATTGLKNIYAILDNVRYNGYYEVISDIDGEWGDALISSGDVQKAQPSCFTFRTKAYSQDGTITYSIVVDGENQADASTVSQVIKDTYSNHDGTGNYLIRWDLFDESASQGISIDYDNTDNNQITFNIPEKTDVEIAWRGCFIPVTVGENTLYLVNGDTGDSYTYEYISYEPNDVVASMFMADTIWNDHRVLTELDVAGYIVPFASKDTDRVSIEDGCTLSMYYNEVIDYIGCIPILTSHFDPKSDFTNKGVKNTYKNKIYMGKTGELDENISLHIRLPPRDWTTLQGLCEIDKPIPINTVHSAFEGDVLNHRGWAELIGVKNVEKTNPLYYKGELDVDYITHNINTRFQIMNGVKVSNYDSNTLRTMLDYVVTSGDEFADYTYTNDDGEIVHNNTGYFNVETDGTYLYDAEQPEYQRTVMTMDNAQTININSVNALSEDTKISMMWLSSKIPEDRENYVDRIIRIKNSDGLTLLEYKYYDYDFYNNKFKCSVNCSVYNKSIGTFETVLEQDMNFATDVESANLTLDKDGKIVQETNDDSDPSYMYGSTLTFELHGNVLNIIDTGFTGREIVKDNIELEKDTYYYEVEFKNKNSDGDTNDILTFFDFVVLENIFNSRFNQLYANMVVSPFPIAHKKMLFTRVCEEGMLYYYENDGTPFTYIQEPFYQYFCGVDLKTRDGISLFNLNNSYTTFYLQNGLVRVGFNRLGGQVYLSKYDVSSNSYVDVASLQLTKFPSFAVGAFSDDKIEVQVGTTAFIMYRGHPYVVIKHENDDIEIRTTYNKAYAESINGINTELPVMWTLVNSDNLLPSCIGGHDVSSACLTVEDIDNEDVGTIPNLSLEKLSPSTVYNGDEVIFNISGFVSDVDEEIPIRRIYDGTFGRYSCSIEVDHIPYSVFVNSDKNPLSLTETNTIQAKVEDYGYEGVANKRVDFYEEYPNMEIITNAVPNPLAISENTTITTLVRDKNGVVVPDARVDFYEEFNVTDVRVSASEEHMNIGQNAEIYANVVDTDGSGIIGERVDFYEEYEVANVVTNSDKAIIQNNDYATISARVTDEDGSLVAGERVDFYEEYEPTMLEVESDTSIIANTDYATVMGRLADADGSAIRDTKVDFYEEYNVSDIEVMSDNKTIVADENTELYARLSDEDGSAIRDKRIDFYEEL